MFPKTPVEKDRPYRVVVFISGRGSNLTALCETIKTNLWPITIAAVISDKVSAPGLNYAQEQGIPTVFVPRRAKDRSNEEFNGELAEKAKEYDPDLLVLAGFMRIVTKELISAFPQRIINIHPSLLPSFRGLHAQEQALNAGVKFAGCTVHYVVEDVDAGPIIAQAVVPVLKEDSVEALSERILKQEHKLLPAVVYALSQNGVVTEKKKDNSLRAIITEEFANDAPYTALTSLR
jgi:phosphoribosylglycinamide formyltransferase-1